MKSPESGNSGYSKVNGLDMYYEVYGKGHPLLLIHGGGSIISTSFGRILPALAKNRQVIAVELQAHGRTNDRETALSFKQDADDVARLLENLRIPKADVLGFSNGGQTAIELGIRHPDVINHLILCSTFYKTSAVFPKFWEGFKKNVVQFSDMPQAYKDAFLEVNNDPAALLNMFNKDVQRMRNFEEWSDAQMESIMLPTLVVNGNEDVASPEHAVEMYRRIPNAQLAIFPGGHGDYMGEITSYYNYGADGSMVLPVLERFLDE